MNRASLPITGFLLSLSTPPCLAQLSDEGLTHRIAALARAAIANRVFPGCQIVVRHGGRTLHAIAYGRETYAANAAAVTMETRYDLDRLTGIVATTGVAMALHVRGKIDLDAKVARDLPGFRGGGRDAVRLRHLLSHTSGLPASHPIFGIATPLTNVPGRQSLYSDVGMMLCGLWLEQRTGRRLDALARELVFAPLSMRHTAFGPIPTDVPTAPTEIVVARGGVVHRRVHDGNADALGGIAGHAGLFSTAQDVAKFAQAVLDGRAPFSKASTRLFTRRANVVPGASRALGFATPSPYSTAGRMLSASSFGHTGFTGTSLWVDPERKLIAVCLTNRVHPTHRSRGIDAFLRTLHDRITQSIDARGKRPYRTAALSVARWLEKQAVAKTDGTVWPMYPAHPQFISTNVYSGYAGIVLYFLRAHASTGESRFLALARRGADALIASLPAKADDDSTGLYTGVAGVGFVLGEVYAATSAEKFRRAARRCVTILRDAGRRTGDGVAWNTSNDIIRGTAGIGLFLLYAADHLEDPLGLTLAEAAGRRLLAVAKATNHGLRWERRRNHPTYQPNFSHGTAGVAYFLLELFRHTHDDEFRAAALEGAAEVVAHGAPHTGLLPHHLPGGEKLFYLGWCHGPAGTAGLYYYLWRFTGDRVWLDRARRAADAIIATGCPERRTPGFWNNESICCGSAGIAAFFLDLYRATEEPRYRTFALRSTDVLLARAERGGDGLSWKGAEYRIHPDQLTTQTGYMQGAAGIGTWLFDLDDWLVGKHRPIRLPDSPFARQP